MKEKCYQTFFININLETIKGKDLNSWRIPRAVICFCRRQDVIRIFQEFLSYKIQIPTEFFYSSYRNPGANKQLTLPMIYFIFYFADLIVSKFPRRFLVLKTAWFVVNFRFLVNLFYNFRCFSVFFRCQAIPLWYTLFWFPLIFSFADLCPNLIVSKFPKRFVSIARPTHELWRNLSSKNGVTGKFL